MPPGRRVSHGGTDEPDYVQVHLGFEGDGMSLIDHSASLPRGPGILLALDDRLEGGPPTRTIITTSISCTGVGARGPLDPGQGDGHILAQLQEFADSIHEGRDPAP